jgi:hypothetical protein
MTGASAAAAAAAAAEAQRRAEEEEQELTPYSEQDLAADWEFKILRSNTGAFKRPEVMRQVCSEEQRAGWVLVEKFDNSRLRFKRPASAKVNDHRQVGIDPYRTTYGMGSAAFGLLIAGATIAAIVLFLIVVALVAE